MPGAATLRGCTAGVLAATILFGVARAREPAAVLGGTFDYKLTVQASGQYIDVAKSNANPDNRIAQIQERAFALEFRPNLHFARGMLDLRVNPRLNLEQGTVVVAGVQSHVSSEDLFINEWSARLTPNESVSVSVGREVLLWGPGLSLSPSDPLYTENGSSNPYRELGGKDLVQGTWYPAEGWTLIYIDNYGQGAATLPPFTPFEHTRLLKVDHTGERIYWSANYAWIENTPDRIGFSLQATLSDAWVAYVDGGYSLSRTQYVPAQDSNGTWGLVPPSGGQRLSGLGLLGLAYTLPAGPTLTLEYVNNNQGWNSTEAGNYVSLAQDAANQIRQGGPLAASAAAELAFSVQPGSPLLNRNYLFLQYLHTNLVKKVDFTLRLTRNLDDDSMRISPIIEWHAGDRLKVFALGAFDTGGPNTEFGRYIVTNAFIGMNASF